MEQDNIIKLENIDSEDISDVLIKIEKSFKIKFGRDELQDVKTFGQLCDVIIDKIELPDVNGCTTQQAFYKLRKAISSTLIVDENTISLKTKLNTLFPKPKRRITIRKIENELGFSLKILRPKHFITGILAICFILSLIAAFINWRITLPGIITSLLGMTIANKYGIELDVTNIGELSEKMSRENYIRSRRDNKTVNKAELEEKIRQLFSHDLDLELHFLVRESSFNS